LVGVMMRLNMMEKNLKTWSRNRDGNLSRDGLFRSRYFRILSNLWEVEPQPIKDILKEIRKEETSQFDWVPGYAGAWKAQRRWT